MIQITLHIAPPVHIVSHTHSLVLLLLLVVVVVDCSSVLQFSWLTCDVIVATVWSYHTTVQYCRKASIIFAGRSRRSEHQTVIYRTFRRLHRFASLLTLMGFYNLRPMGVIIIVVDKG